MCGWVRVKIDNSMAKLTGDTRTLYCNVVSFIYLIKCSMGIGNVGRLFQFIAIYRNLLRHSRCHIKVNLIMLINVDYVTLCKG